MNSRRDYIIYLRDKRMTFREIGELIGISKQRVHQICNYITSRLQGRDLTRELVRIRDGHTCKICLKKWEKGKRRFDCHHIDGNCGKKSLSYDRIKDLNTLITLCHKCHMNLHSVRKKMSK